MPSHPRSMFTGISGRRRILVVDQQYNLRETVAALLRTNGYDASTSADAMAAWKLLNAQGCFDILLTSIKLEPFNGFELIRRVMGDFPLTEVVAMSSYATVEVELEALRLGAREFLSKPFELNELLIRLDRTLEYRWLRDRALGPGAPRSPWTSTSFLPGEPNTDR